VSASTAAVAPPPLCTCAVALRGVCREGGSGALRRRREQIAAMSKGGTMGGTKPRREGLSVQELSVESCSAALSPARQCRKATLLWCASPRVRRVLRTHCRACTSHCRRAERDQLGWETSPGRTRRGPRARKLPPSGCIWARRTRVCPTPHKKCPQYTCRASGADNLSGVGGMAAAVAGDGASGIAHTCE
jgi:hypothetical protein